MKPFQNILVHIDVDAQHHRALARAKQLAKDHGGTLRLISHVEEAGWLTDKLLGGLASRLQAKLVDETAEKLNKMAALVADESIPVSTATLIGRGWLEVIREAIGSQSDVVFMDAADSEIGTIDPRLDLRVLRKCPCPVWLVKSTVPTLRRIAAAIDLAPGDDRRNEFNAKILKLATWIARTEGCQLDIVRAWSIYGESILKSHMSEEEMLEVKKEKREAIEKCVNEFVRPLVDGVPTVNIHIPEGAPEDIIPAFANHKDEDLLVMGTIARTGVAGVIIGNTAEIVLQKLKCSVLAVKPDDYVSPVRIN